MGRVAMGRYGLVERARAGRALVGPGPLVGPEPVGLEALGRTLGGSGVSRRALGRPADRRIVEGCGRRARMLADRRPDGCVAVVRAVTRVRVGAVGIWIGGHYHP
jgi:hypothetical protein